MDPAQSRRRQIISQLATNPRGLTITLQKRLCSRCPKERGAPSIVLGDLNDVAWSPTTLNFMRSGNLLDPRRGRGFYNTYPARWPGLRYPLDYVFSTKHFSVGTMRVLPQFGSDHLPLVAELFAEPMDPKATK